MVNFPTDDSLLEPTNSHMHCGGGKCEKSLPEEKQLVKPGAIWEEKNVQLFLELYYKCKNKNEWGEGLKKEIFPEQIIEITHSLA